LAEASGIFQGSDSQGSIVFLWWSSSVTLSKNRLALADLACFEWAIQPLSEIVREGRKTQKIFGRKEKATPSR
jgi:hypothetical protein